MNPAQLLAHFEKISDAPDAIPRLRRFILALAIRGKLVPQNPKDEPASALLKRIEAEKVRLTRIGRIKVPVTLPALGRGDTPFDLPSSWAWVRLGTVFEYDAGIKLDPKELRADRWLLELEDIEKDSSVVLTRLRVGDRDSLSTKSQFEVGDILYGKLRPYLNKVVVADEPGYSTTEIVSIRPYLKLCPEYCALALRRPDFVAYVERLGRGTKMPRLRTPDAVAAVFPLPPLSEQPRIVAKVDELMAFCGRLEVARAERESWRDRLAASSLARLNTSAPDRFKDDARFALEVLPALTSRPDQVKQLRRTILNLAVRGGLSQQASRSQRAKKLGDVASLQNGYAFKSEWFSKTGIRLVRNANVAHGVLDWEEEVRLPDHRAPEFERFKLSEGDVVVSLDRPFIVSGTKVARVCANDLPPLLLQRVGRFILQPSLDASYVYLWVTSPHFAEQIDPGRSNGVPHISSKQVEAAEIFVPPLAEQRRLIAKVDELMMLCDQLEASLRRGAGRRSGLLAAILNEALQPSEERDEAA